MKFSAAVLRKVCAPLEIVGGISVPALKPGQVLVKISFAGVCHSQLMEIDGLRGTDKYIPHMLGHEGSGTVVDTGAGVTKVKEGDRVALGWLKGKGKDVPATQYDSPIGKINAGAVTTFSEYAVVSENRCYLIPKSLSMTEAVLFGCALPTGLGMIENQTELSTDSTIAIYGLGGIGLSSLLGATQKNPKQCIVIDSNENKLELALNLGATHTINPKRQNVHDEVMSLTNGNGVDFCIEAAGSCDTIEQAFSLLSPSKGKCVFASHPAKGHKISLDPHELICGKTIEGSWGGKSDPEQILQTYSNENVKSKLPYFLSEKFSLLQINQALNSLRQKKVVRAILKMG